MQYSYRNPFRGFRASAGIGTRGHWWQGIQRRMRPDKEQRKTLLILAAMFVVIIVMFQWSVTRLILYPFAIISTVFHEFGHALAVHTYKQ